MILGWNVYGKSVQPHFHINRSMTPFSLIITTHTLHDRLRVVVFHSLKKPTWIGRHIRLVAEVLDHSFNSAVTDRGHVEHTTLFLTAVESQLSERQLWPEFFHCAQCDVVSFLGTIYLPPSIFISQYTFKGFPLPSGSIQYSPSPLESFDSRICLQDFPGFTEK